MGGPSLSLLLIATPPPGEAGAEEEHRDVLQELAISLTGNTQPPQASVTGTNPPPDSISAVPAFGHSSGMDNQLNFPVSSVQSLSAVPVTYPSLHIGIKSILAYVS